MRKGLGSSGKTTGWRTGHSGGPWRDTERGSSWQYFHLRHTTQQRCRGWTEGVGDGSSRETQLMHLASSRWQDCVTRSQGQGRKLRSRQVRKHLASEGQAGWVAASDRTPRTSRLPFRSTEVPRNTKNTLFVVPTYLSPGLWCSHTCTVWLLPFLPNSPVHTRQPTANLPYFLCS